MTIFEDLFSLKGKTALVTGGASGIGAMISSALVQAGSKVFIVSRKGEDCIRMAGELNQLAKDTGSSGSAEGFSGTVANEQGIKEIVAEITSRTNKLDILVNNAGTTWGAPMEEFPHEAWNKVLDLNVSGLFTLTRDLLPLLEKSASEADPSRIINLGSVMGTSPMGDGAYSYAASKAAVHHLTKIMAKECAHKHITINAFAPGPFSSRMTAFATNNDEKAKTVAKQVPLGRMGDANDIAAATLYLCGKGGAYVTGAILPIDGGLHISSGANLFEEASKKI